MRPLTWYPSNHNAMKVSLLLLLTLLRIPMWADSISLNGSGTGYVYEGVCGVSAGASSRYIYDYPVTQRNHILDYLAKPHYGASLQCLKSEIGGDTTAGGSEPSHERSSGVIDCTRGYEWDLMKAFQSRNATVTLDSLAWGWPAWVTSQYTANSRQYVIDYLGCAAANSLTMNYTGVSNEDGGAISGWESWVKTLRTDMNSAGYSSTKIIARDGTGTYRWDVCASVAGDGTLQSSIYAMGSHYINQDSDVGCKALTPTTKIWDSEDNQGTDGSWCDTWTCGQNMAKMLIANYAGAYSTRSEIWALITANNPLILLGHSGLMRAEEPWSGYYETRPNLWAVAHMTQFTEIGWQYIDHIALGGGGDCVALKSNTTSDYSVICHTKGAGSSQSLTGTITNGLSTGIVHAWKSDSSTQFIQQTDITPSAGSWTATLAADAIYSFTTTTGQAKGSASGLSSTGFPVPYHDTFETTTTGKNAKYLSDINGAWEVGSCVNTTGKCIIQKVTSSPVFWPSQSGGYPQAIIGDNVMTDYQVVATDYSLYSSGDLIVLLHCTSQAASGEFAAYQLHVTSGGAWSITMRSALAVTLASGSGLSVGTNTKHTFAFKIVGLSMTASMDGTQFGTATDNGTHGETYTAGPAGIATSGWFGAEVGELAICATSGCPNWASPATYTGSITGTLP